MWHVVIYGDKVTATSQAEGRGFDPRLPLHLFRYEIVPRFSVEGLLFWPSTPISTPIGGYFEVSKAVSNRSTASLCMLGMT